MKITELFKNTPRTYSFEFFPPKDEISAVDFGINVGTLLKLAPSFVTVTYGAGGSTQERTFALVDYLKNKIGLNTMAHYTCIAASREKTLHDLQALQQMGMENLMLLRGDPPAGTTAFAPPADGFKYASELVAFVKAQGFDFCIGGGAYPEKHPDAVSTGDDIRRLKEKVTAGADFLITQLFFINEIYFNFVAQCQQAGITCRIIPGIMPVTSYSQLIRSTKMSRAAVPPELEDSIKTYENNPKKIYQTGMDYAIQQCRDLLLMGAPGLHFYTLNKSRATVEIFETLMQK
ncbi:MAG: methylenetetrahydrofolate reductase [NAD(P)H] [Prevotellaceae bacterium]|jgi:methylenetetrahydrofolate reductase (NADPH)|nr:methylenetetrahydrofolate reductase [NAD(P)H] [Prevotellaceae bacterium]